MLRLLRSMTTLGLVTVLLGGVPPAQAATVVSATFTSEMRTGCGLGYPVFTGSIPPFPSNGPMCGFAFSGGLCVTGTVRVLKEWDTGPLVTPFCTLSGEGWVTGYCGLWEGSGQATLDFPPSTVTLSFDMTNTGGTVVVSGSAIRRNGTQRGPLFGVFEAIPPTSVLTPAGGSCLSGSATFFTLAGTLDAVLLPFL